MNKLISILFVVFISFQLNAQISDCSVCSIRLLNRSELEGKGPEELALMRNEIFARNGYIFKNNVYSDYFGTKSWYSPSSTDVKLSKIETDNVNFLKEIEDKLKKNRNICIQNLKKLKQALNAGDKETVVVFFKTEDDITVDTDDITSTFKTLKETLNKIDLNSLFWNKNGAFYKRSVDNGYSIESWELRMNVNEITIRTGLNSHSENFGDFDDGYSGYRSESEYAEYWIFKVTDTGIKFTGYRVVG